jgi:hypothetical protein
MFEIVAIGIGVVIFTGGALWAFLDARSPSDSTPTAVHLDCDEVVDDLYACGNRFVRLRNGYWGVCVHGRAGVGQAYRVLRADGEYVDVTVVKVLYKTSHQSVCEIDFTWRWQK